MELKYMNMKVKYGNIIHADGTVLKRTITTYGTVEEFREYLGFTKTVEI